MSRVCMTLLILVVAVAGIAAAQGLTPPGGFPANPHPTMPWFGPPYPGRSDYGVVPNRPPIAQDAALYGRVVRYIEVPPQQMEIQVYVPGPGSFSGDYQSQTVEIPSYVVTETTTGYLYPERWSLEQVTQGVYQWRALPPLFTRK